MQYRCLGNVLLSLNHLAPIAIFLSCQTVHLVLNPPLNKRTEVDLVYWRSIKGQTNKLLEGDVTLKQFVALTN